MNITDVSIRLISDQEGKLRGYARVTFDNAFIVKDIRIIQGESGLFIAMPSRKLTAPCLCCGFKNTLQANYCNQCGKPGPTPPRRRGGRGPLFADIAHPINEHSRAKLEAEVLKAYRALTQKTEDSEQLTEPAEADIATGVLYP